MYIPGTQMTSIFEGQPLKTRPFLIKTRVTWSSRYIYIGIQSPCQRMIGVYNHLRNARYFGSITILRR